MDCPRLDNIYVYPVAGNQKVEMIDYNLILYIGLGLIIGGFCLFLYSEHKIRQCDIELARQKKLSESFLNGKVEEYKKS